MGWGRQIPPCLGRAVAELQRSLQPQGFSSPQRPHTGGQCRGSAGDWEASLCFPSGVGKDAPRWPQGLGHCGPVLLRPGSEPWAPTARPPRSHALRQPWSLASAPFPLETSSVCHLCAFSYFFFFNVFFDAMFAVRLNSFVGVIFVVVVLFKPQGV